MLSREAAGIMYEMIYIGEGKSVASGEPLKTYTRVEGGKARERGRGTRRKKDRITAIRLECL